MKTDNQRAWVFFFLLSLIWGSSFLLMRVGVEEIPPAQLTFTRVGIAAIGMNILMLVTRRRYPTDWRTLGALAIIGFGNSALPFTLLAWGEQTVGSGLAAVLQAITPAFALVIAHFTFADERITPVKIAGVSLSFLGILVLFGNQDGQPSTPEGQIAVIVASLAYAAVGTFSRKVLQRTKIEPFVVASGTMIPATIFAGLMALAAPLIGERGPVAYSALSQDVLLSALALGFFNTFLAYLMFYNVLATLGVSRTSTVTYVVPFVAVTLGAIFLQEPVDARLMLGGLLIIGGIGIINLPVMQFARRLIASLSGVRPVSEAETRADAVR